MDIETLPNEILLEIIDLYLGKDNNEGIDPWYCMEGNQRDPYDAWYALVHVCQRWRYIVFASPRRLNLRLHCSRRRLVRKTLDIWPAFPIIIWDLADLILDEDNIIAALEQHDRVCEIRLECFSRSQSETLLPLMQESFPALTNLQIESPSRDEPPLLLPDLLLGGCAPHLRFLSLQSVSFPALPNLLLSASHLVYLYLCGIPSGYFPLEMVTALSALTKLESMRLVFVYTDSDSDLRDPPSLPLKRSVLPALKVLELQGDGECLDDFVARIDVPSVIYLKIVFDDRPFFVVDFFHLPQFIGRVEKFRTLNHAELELGYHAMDVTLSLQDSQPGTLQLNFLCDTAGPLSSLMACNTSLLPLSNIEYFGISTRDSNRDSQSEFYMEDPLWLDVLRQFSAAKSLFLGSMHIVPPVAFTLKQVTEEGMTDVLPAIQKLSIYNSRSLQSGPVREAIEQFVAARGLLASENPAILEWGVRERDADDG